MKILATGDFHGTFPTKFEKIIKKEKIDFVLSNGDHFPFSFRKLWFKHSFGTGKELWEVIGKENYKKLMTGDVRKGERAIKKLNDLPVPVFTTVGNIDYTRLNDAYDMRRYEKKYGKPKRWKWDEQDFFTPVVKKYENIRRVDYRFARFGDYVIIGASGGTSPGHVQSAAYRKHNAILVKLFKKFSKENSEGKIILLTHNMPYNTKLDKIGMKAHVKVRGKHFGSKMVRRIVNRYQPILQIGGHIHEGRGMQKLGKTTCINTGSAHEGQGAIIELTGKNVKVKFV